MGTTRQAISHYYDECLKCNYRNGHDCIYKKRIKEKCVWYRKKRNGHELEEPKLTKCPLKDEENTKEMNKKEVLDAISQEFRKSLQDLGVTNADVWRAIFPNVTKLTLDWALAPYKAENEGENGKTDI